MKSTLPGSIGAVAAGFAATLDLSYGTDFALRAAGVIPYHNLNVSAPLIVVVIAYRTIFSVFGSGIAASLAPKSPMGHALTLGAIGCAGSIAATAATWNMDLGPHWYGLTITALALPSAWLGATLNQMRTARTPVNTAKTA